MGVIVSSCDEVDDPYEHLDEFTSDTGDSRFNDTTFNDTTLATRGLLLEDFTGHQCPNCPVAQDVSKTLLEDNPGVVFAAAIHNARSFSEPEPPEFPANYETETGEKLLEKYKIGGFPSGIINRSSWNGSTTVGYQQWQNVINTQKADAEYMAPRFKLRATKIYNTESRWFRVIPSVTALRNITGEVFVVAYLLENKIVSPQVDNRLPAPSIAEEYVHNHLLRVGFPQDGDGRKLFSNPTSGDIYTTNAAEEELRVKLDDSWNAENCEVMLIIVSRNADEEEILHVEVSEIADFGN